MNLIEARAELYALRMCAMYNQEELQRWCGREIKPEVLDMAIETLQNLTKPNKSCEDDLIWRRDAAKQFCNDCKGLDEPCEHQMSCQTMKVLNSLPSAGQNCILCEYYTEIETDDGIKGKCTRRTGSDLISRQDAINAMWKALYDYEDLTEKQFMEHEELEFGDWFLHRIFVQNMHAECMNAVLSLPTAEPKMGEWIDKGNWMGIECSRCKCHSRYVTPFCPQCGARMLREDGE